MANMGASIYPTHSSSLTFLLPDMNCLFGVHMIIGLCVVSNTYAQSK